MTPAAIVLAVAVAAWGPVAPAPPALAQPVTPAAPLPPLSSPPAPSAPPAAIQPAIIAKAPVDVRAAPALVAAPRARSEPRPPLYKDWKFWVLAGGFFAGVVILTIAETRPGPEPYAGNAPPYYIGFP